MSTEVWMRNPSLYVRECLEVGVEKIAWDAGIVKKFALDPVRFMDLHYGLQPWRAIIMHEHGAIEVGPGDRMSKPRAVYPIWEYGDEWSDLERLVANPVGNDHAACSDTSVETDYRPVYGQEHRVVVIRPPIASSTIGRSFYRTLKFLQEEHPEVILHIHGVYSYRILFGLGFRSVDIDPRTSAQKGKVMLPMGRELTYEHAAELPHWVNLLGFRTSDLKVPRNRCMYNIKSALWAGEHFQQDVKFRWKGYNLDPDDPTRTAKKLDRRIFVKNVQESVGDKFVCDACSLASTCKFFRVGAVCAVPGTEPQKMSQMMGTRDSGTIIDGLAAVLSAQTRRFEEGLAAEAASDDGELDPEVTRIFNSLFKAGVNLAKLIDPTLRASPTLNFKFQHNQATITAASPQQLMAAVVDELVKRGIRRQDITPEMVEAILSKPEDQRERAIAELAKPIDPAWEAAT